MPKGALAGSAHPALPGKSPLAGKASATVPCSKKGED